MDWKCDVVHIREGYSRAIVDIDTKEIVVMVDNLDSGYVKAIINAHNKSISLARRDGVDIAKEVYKSGGTI